ncbi:6-phosphogluconolactonase [Ferrimonas marina]|uniref:6-phosphogluconolactonase n=1 Tax=Ferrimonas marina TaxID=299255 RepID=A0A1M5N678_9GAMM|nr:6-phosphogluconolactonase [Ferrimonas marina]SHG85064.1 6-phosphogluconolactonase [Ferrimonas marina]
MTAIALPVMKTFARSDELVAQLAKRICQQLQDSVDQRGSASLFVSGGSTPLPLFQAMSKIGIDWQEVCISLVDERWVGPEHADSNERLVREHLLQNRAAGAKFVGLVTMHATPEEGVAMATDRLSHFPRPYDVVILGMGGDGHTASLFPCCEQLEEGFNTEATLLATHPTKAPHGRISLSLKAILNARQIYLHIGGVGKKEVLDAALAGTDAKELPIRAVLAQSQTPIDVYWSEA